MYFSSSCNKNIDCPYLLSDTSVLSFNCIQEKHTQQLKILLKNISAQTIYLHYSLIHSTSHAFTLQSPTTTYLYPNQCEYVLIQFKPLFAMFYKDSLSISIENVHDQYFIPIYGYGGICDVICHPLQSIYTVSKNTHQYLLYIENQGNQNANIVIEPEENASMKHNEYIIIEPSKFTLVSQSYINVIITLKNVAPYRNSLLLYSIEQCICDQLHIGLKNHYAIQSTTTNSSVHNLNTVLSLFDSFDVSNVSKTYDLDEFDHYTDFQQFENHLTSIYIPIPFFDSPQQEEPKRIGPPTSSKTFITPTSFFFSSSSTSSTESKDLYILNPSEKQINYSFTQLPSFLRIINPMISSSMMKNEPTSYTIQPYSEHKLLLIVSTDQLRKEMNSHKYVCYCRLDQNVIPIDLFVNSSSPSKQQEWSMSSPMNSIEPMINSIDWKYDSYNKESVFFEQSSCEFSLSSYESFSLSPTFSISTTVCSIR